MLNGVRVPFLNAASISLSPCAVVARVLSVCLRDTLCDILFAPVYTVGLAYMTDMPRDLLYPVPVD